MGAMEDFEVFFNDQEFATPAWVRGHRIVGLESQGWVTSQDVDLLRTTFICPSRVVLEIRQGEVIRLGEVQAPYRVVGMHPNETGLTVLALEKIVWNCP